MKADITRSTFKREKHYTGVRMQQGRVQLDADWNEQVDITNHRLETEATDVIGRGGASEDSAGFDLESGENKLRILAARNQDGKAIPGHYFVDGVLCEIDNDIPFDQQPDLPGARLPEKAGYYLAYLDVWQRHVTDIEDSSIHEVALGNADTTTRTKTVWQVKTTTEPVAALVANVPPCQTEFPDWSKLTAPRQVRLAAQVVLLSIAVEDPGAISRAAESERIENQLYRVEIHTAGKIGQATFKWSRDNGSVVGKIKSIDGNLNTIELTDAPRDEFRSFAPGQWIEIIDETFELNDGAGVLVKLASPTSGTLLTYDPNTATAPIPIERLNDPKSRAKVRRWDQRAIAEIPTGQSWIDLELGIQVKFEAETDHEFKAGDYWFIPGRTITQRIEWLVDDDGNPVLVEPDGIAHHYAKLAILHYDGAGWEREQDCRQIHSSLTKQWNLFYLSGDGQGDLPGKLLQEPLRVGVTNGVHKVEGARVQFRITKGEGSLHRFEDEVEVVKELDIYTNSVGIAECFWRLSERLSSGGDIAQKTEQVEANLLDYAGGRPLHLPIRFNANLTSIAEVELYRLQKCGTQQSPTVQYLFYKTTPDWPDLDKDGAITVQDILDALICKFDAQELPFLHKSGPSYFPNDVEQTVAAALDYLSQRIVPTGMILAFANVTPPQGWLECDGGWYYQEDYPNLYKAIQSKFGQQINKDNQKQEFRVPDLRGEFIRGWINDRTDLPEEAKRPFGNWQRDELQTHTHADSGHTHADSGHIHPINDPGHRHDAPTSTGTIGQYEVPPTTPHVDFDYIGAAPTNSSVSDITVSPAQAILQNAKAILGEPEAFGDGGIPKLGKETRPRNVALMYCIKT